MNPFCPGPEQRSACSVFTSLPKLITGFCSSSFRNYHKRILCGLALATLSLPARAQAVTEVITDYNGYWKSGSGAINPVKPDNSHNLLAFVYQGRRYSTGVNDELLTRNNDDFSAQAFRALPVSTISGTIDGNTKIGLGALYDGNSDGPSNPPPVNCIPRYLTDGLQGLDLGTCVANLPVGTLSFPMNNIKSTAIGDGIPDLLVTQVADPTVGSYDEYTFYDINGQRVSNIRQIIFTNIAPVGNWVADFYEANRNPMTLQSSFTNGQRPIRLWTADFSDFGITTTNFSSIETFQIRLSGVSDVAFVAYNVNSLSPNSSANQPLPVTLTAFEGKARPGQVQLNWKTASEQNSASFTVEASTDGAVFAAVGTVKAAGNSNKTLSYTFTHQTAEAGGNYYRLKQTDLDGSFAYSNIIFVAPEKSLQVLQLVPNPAHDQVQVSHPGGQQGVLELRSLNGQLLRRLPTDAGTTQTLLLLQQLPKGIYQLSWTGGNTHIVQKLVIQ